MSELGEFLRSSRDRVAPHQVGLKHSGRRRVAGLRREEVAQLAGVSADYYTRLEQGREHSPSPQVADALGRALRLDEHALSHLYRLAQLTPARSAATADTVDPVLAAMLEEWPAHPALVLGRAFDVLAANPLAEAVFLGFTPDRNLILSMFLDPNSRTLYRDWNEVAESTTAGFRLLHSANPDDDRVHDVLERLTASSPEFRRMWADHTVRGRRLESKRLTHPAAGEVTLQIQTFDVRSAPGQELVIYRAGSEADAAALRRLPISRPRAPGSTES